MLVVRSWGKMGEETNMNFYEKNMEIIKRQNPELAERLRNTPDKPWIEVIKSKSGLPTIRVNNRLLHSFYDPIKEAMQLIDEQKFRDKDNLIIFGFGLGYHISEILRRGIEFNQMFVIEPSIEIFKVALRERDLSEILKLKGLRLLVGLEPLQVFDNLCNLAIWVVSSSNTILEHPPSVIINSDYFDELRPIVVDSIRTAAANIVTIKSAGKIFIENITRNLAEAVRSPGVKTLFNKFKKVPAIIVSAGPSLDKNIDLLHQAKGKALILATDTALKILHLHGIKPDFVFTADFKRKSKLHFENLQVDDIPLIFEIEAAHASLKSYKGPKFVAASTKPLPFWINTLTPDKGIVTKGMSVAHFTFNIAEKMGCDPIIFIGQDLSFPGGFSHAKGTSSRIKVENNSRDMRLMKIKSLLTGEELITDHCMYIYLRHFEKLISQTDRLCINATEGGAGIKGTKVMTLKEAISQYCIKEIDIKGIIDKSRREAEEPDLVSVIMAIKQMRKKLTRVEKASAKVISMLEEIFRLSQEDNSDRDKISRLLRGLTEPLSEVKSEEAILRIIHADIIKGMMAMQREGEFTPERIRNRKIKDIPDDFKNDMEFQQAVNKGVVFLNKGLKRALRDLKILQQATLF